MCRCGNLINRCACNPIVFGVFYSVQYPYPMNQRQLLPSRPSKRLQRITLYPTLVTQHQFWIQLYNVDTGCFSVHLYTLHGQEVFTHFYTHQQINTMHAIQVHDHIGRGIYKVAVRCDEVQYVQNIVIT